MMFGNGSGKAFRTILLTFVLTLAMFSVCIFTAPCFVVQ